MSLLELKERLDFLFKELYNYNISTDDAREEIELYVQKNIDQVISSFKPTIFWKDKEVIKQQISFWPLKKIEKLIIKINEVEIIIKKNSTNSINILCDFIINQSSKVNN